MRVVPKRGLLVVASVVMLVAIVTASLVPATWQVRLGLHWLVEHFLAYFAATLIFCLAWQRPMAVAAVLLPFAVAIEAAQELTAALLADLVLWLKREADRRGNRRFSLGRKPWQSLHKCDVSLRSWTAFRDGTRSR